MRIKVILNMLLELSFCPFIFLKASEKAGEASEMPIGRLPTGLWCRGLWWGKGSVLV